MPDETRIDGFKFLIPLAKATQEDGKLYVEGIASSLAIDAQGQRITRDGQASMARWANTGSVALGGEADHYKVAFDDDLGYIEKGEVTPDGEFFIRAMLDPDNPRAVHLHRKIAGGSQLGLSVFGRVTKSALGEDNVPEIQGVHLTRVMVTKRPANPDTWITAVAKSLDADPDAPAPLDVAKGKFLELLAAYQERAAARAPVTTQATRVAEIVRMTRFLEDAAAQVEWDSGGTPEQIAEAMALAIAEYQSAVVAKDGAGDATPEAADALPTGDAPEAADAPSPDPEPAPEAAFAPQTAAPQTADAPAAVAASAPVPETAPMPVTQPAPTIAESAPQVPAVDETVDEHPVVRMAKSFTDAASALFAADLEPSEQRAGMRSLLGDLAAGADAALSAPAPRTAESDTPAWAVRLLERMDGLEQRLAAAPAGPVAKSDGRPEAGTAPAPSVNFDALRKSVPAAPDIRPSAVVAKAASFADIVGQLFGASPYPDKL